MVENLAIRQGPRQYPLSINIQFKSQNVLKKDVNFSNHQHGFVKTNTH